MERSLEDELAARLQAGDRSAFDEIYDLMNPRLLGFLSRMAKDRSIAEDLLEETWLRLISSAAGLRAQTRIVPWLFTVARNLYVSYCRSRTREQSYTSDLILLWPGEMARTPLDLALFNQFEQRLETALAELPPPIARFFC